MLLTIRTFTYYVQVTFTEHSAWYCNCDIFQKTLNSSFRAKARMSSLRGTPERENGGVGGPGSDGDVAKSMSTVPIARSSAVSLV